ncbi:MAG: hypothetical protein WC108_04685 [Bacteroidales bacterium]|jgi:antitoxin component YwqK of YwqJK toxin-antitoxin module|nr:hypothetical protein [Bacteroidales bacterium]MDD4002061.1 hypothetical protein [Bacteroidales bacterium]MDD4829351.1 hypothetical protein [Bacteroidales bacterium]
MNNKNLTALFSKAIIIIFALLINSSCSSGTKEVISYYENGNPKLVYYIKKDNGVKNKVAEKLYYENGKLKYEGKFEQNERTGKWFYYFENGNIFAQCDYTNSKSGNNWEVNKIDKTKIVTNKDKVKEVTYYPDGALAAIKIIYDKYEKEYSFFQSFQLLEERTYKGNILNGQSLSFYENGKINSTNYFKDGMQDSIYVLYYENGSTQIKGNFKMDNKIGKWEFFKKDGTSDGEEIYGEDGSILKSRNTGIKLYDKEGNEIKI